MTSNQSNLFLYGGLNGLVPMATAAEISMPLKFKISCSHRRKSPVFVGIQETFILYHKISYRCTGITFAEIM